MHFATRYRPPASPSVVTVGKSATRQEFKAECDVNTILARMGAGLVAPLAAPEPVYADLDAVPSSYEECLRLVQDADARFAALPARLRDRFGNKPDSLLSFLSDSNNREEAIKLGLISPPSEDSKLAETSSAD